MIDITTKESTDKKKKRDAPNRHDSKDNKKAKYIIRKITRILPEKL